MTEKEMYILLQSIITDGLLTVFSLPNVDVRQGDQPTIQGTPSGPAVILTNQPARRFGFLKRADEWNTGSQTMVHTETQIMTTQFQVGALWPQDVQAVDAETSPTAADLVNYVARIIQSDAGREALRAGGATILRVTDIQNPNFKDERDQFESSPSFLFTLCHQFVDVSTTPVVDHADPDLVAI
jgi:hypothetical protein